MYDDQKLRKAWNGFQSIYILGFSSIFILDQNGSERFRVACFFFAWVSPVLCDGCSFQYFLRRFLREVFSATAVLFATVLVGRHVFLRWRAMFFASATCATCVFCVGLVFRDGSPCFLRQGKEEEEEEEVVVVVVVIVVVVVVAIEVAVMMKKQNESSEFEKQKTS